MKATRAAKTTLAGGVLAAIVASLFLLVTLTGLCLGKRHHGSWTPFLVGAVGAALTVASIWFGNGVLAGVGIAGLVAGSLFNVWLRMQQLQ